MSSTSHELPHPDQHATSSDALTHLQASVMHVHAQAPSQAPGYFGFQTLPAEVRIKIWQAYEIQKPGNDFIGSSKKGRATDGDGFKTEMQRYSGHAARQLCRTFNDEILDMFYGSNGFEFFHTTVLLEFMESAGARARSWMKKIKIHFSLTHVATATHHAAHTAYKGLRYLKSCTRLESLEIDARVIPEKLTACWLSYPVPDVLSLISNDVGKDGVEVLFGDEQKHYQWGTLYQRSSNAYVMDDVKAKTGRDLRMISMTKELVSKALLKVVAEFAETGSRSSLPNVIKGAPKPWKGVPPKEKARLARRRAKDSKDAKDAKQTRRNDLTFSDDDSEDAEYLYTHPDDEDVGDQADRRLYVTDEDLTYVLTDADIPGYDPSPPYMPSGRIEGLDGIDVERLPLNRSIDYLRPEDSATTTMSGASDESAFHQQITVSDAGENGQPVNGGPFAATGPCISSSRRHRSPNAQFQQRLPVSRQGVPSGVRPTDNLPSSYLHRDDRFMEDFVNFEAGDRTDAFHDYVGGLPYSLFDAADLNANGSHKF